MTDTADLDSLIPVRVCTLRGDLKIPFDLFIYLRGKHVHYVRKGDSFDGDRLTRLREKKLKKLWIRAEDEKLYQSYIAQNLDQAFESGSQKEIQTRAEVIHGACQSAAEDLLETPQNVVFYKLAGDQATRLISAIKSEPQLLAPLLSHPNTERDMGFHSATVAILSITMGLKLKLEQNLTTLAIGALLHDLGHQISGGKFGQDLAALRPDEQAVYRSHPIIGAERLKNLPHVDEAIRQIVENHEENANGTGYPEGKVLTLQKDSLAMIVGVANYFDRWVGLNGQPADLTIKKMLTDKVGCYPIEYLSALKSIFTEQGII